MLHVHIRSLYIIVRVRGTCLLITTYSCTLLHLFCRHVTSFTIAFMFACYHVLSDNVNIQLFSAWHRHYRM